MLRDGDVRGLYQLATAGCRERTSVSEIEAGLALIEELSPSLFNAEVGEFEVGTQDGARATVVYSLVDRDDPSVVVVRIDVGDPSTFVWEDDQWKGPDCG